MADKPFINPSSNRGLTPQPANQDSSLRRLCFSHDFIKQQWKLLIIFFTLLWAMTQLMSTIILKLDSSTLNNITAKLLKLQIPNENSSNQHESNETLRHF